jgi:hypothetical protein
MMKHKDTVPEKLFFEVYEKYINVLGEDGTAPLDVDFEKSTLDYLEQKQKEYGVSMSALVGGYLELQIDRKKQESEV